MVLLVHTVYVLNNQPKKSCSHYLIAVVTSKVYAFVCPFQNTFDAVNNEGKTCALIVHCIVAGLVYKYYFFYTSSSIVKKQFLHM